MNLLSRVSSGGVRPSFLSSAPMATVVPAAPLWVGGDRATLEREPLSSEDMQGFLSALGQTLSLSPAIQPVTGDPAPTPELAGFIDNYLVSQGSPAAGQDAGRLMIEVGREFQIDPLLLLAIAGHETVYGTQGIGVNGLLGVGAYDDDPENATRDPQFSGVEAQIRRGAETFARLRQQGGSGPKDSIAEQLAAVNRAGWATDPNWHLGVMRHYNQIQEAHPPEGGETSQAIDYGWDEPAVNPYTEDTNWDGWGLGWVNQALQSVGMKVPELQAETSADAYEQLQISGKLQQGKPKPGSVIFFEEGDRIRIGLVGPDGTTVRVTQAPDDEGRSLGDIPLPEPNLGWFEPTSSAAPVAGVDPNDPASFFITQNTTQWNPEARYNSEGKNANCGPTSLAMAALAFGMLPPGTDPSHPQGIIDAVRVAMTGNDNVSQLTGTGDVNQGAEALGMSHHDVGTLAEVDAALASGMMVVAGSVDHFVLITGRSPDGGYVVNDPMYTGQPGVVKSVEEMQGWFIGGVAVGP